MNGDGSGQTRLTHDPNPDVYDYGPAWSPNGNMIAFTRHRSGFNFDIYVMNPDGSAQRQVSSGPGWNADPAWAITVAK